MQLTDDLTSSWKWFPLIKCWSQLRIFNSLLCKINIFLRMKNKCNILTATRNQIPASHVQAWRTLYHSEWQEAKCSVKDCWEGTSPSCSQLCAFGHLSCCNQEALDYSVCCLNLSTAVQNKPSMDGLLLHWVIKHFVEGSDSHQCWQTKERQRKAWKVEGARVNWALVGGTGWLPI